MRNAYFFQKSAKLWVCFSKYWHMYPHFPHWEVCARVGKLELTFGIGWGYPE